MPACSRRSRPPTRCPAPRIPAPGDSAETAPMWQNRPELNVGTSEPSVGAHPHRSPRSARVADGGDRSKCHADHVGAGVPGRPAIALSSQRRIRKSRVARRAEATFASEEAAVLASVRGNETVLRHGPPRRPSPAKSTRSAAAELGCKPATA